MRRSLTHIGVGILLLISFCALAVSGFVLAGWNVLDAIYFVVITIFGVGYGEVHPIDTVGLKWFTILVVVGGTSSVVYIVSGVIQLMTADEIRKSLGAMRMSKSIENLREHTIICGFGRMGQILARDLQVSRAKFVIIESDPQRVAEAEALGYYVNRGNASDESTLIEMGVKRATALATVLPNDADNVFITLSARTLNRNLNIIARGEMPSTEVKLRRAGADHVILPPAIGGSRIAELILHPQSSDLLDTISHERTFSDELAKLGLALTELLVAEDSVAVDKRLAEIVVRGRDQHTVVAVRPGGGSPVYHPEPGFILHALDTLVLVGPADDQPTIVPRNGPAVQPA